MEEGWSQVGLERGKPWAQHFQWSCVDWSLMVGIIGYLADHTFMQVDQDTLQVWSREEQKNRLTDSELSHQLST